MLGYNCDLVAQKNLLLSIVSKNDVLLEILIKTQLLGLKNYYIGAGCICQTVWNYQNDKDLMYGISDIDFVYFDDSDISYEAEDFVIKKVKQQFLHLPVDIDVKNQARVHLWYKARYGYDIKPYTSLEEAINTCPTTATSVGIRMVDKDLLVYAPFGLNDMFGQVIRANKTQITKDTYITKCQKWIAKWPTLKIIDWEE